MTDPVMVGIASIPERADALRHTLESIAPQADQVFLSLNDYPAEPAWLDQFPNVTATVRPVNDGDAEKFAAVDDWDGIVVTCDDDLIYPADYITTLLAGLDRHGHDKIVGFHGGKTLGFNGAHLAATHKQIRCLGELEADDVDVNVLGTGALAFDARFVPVWRDLFRSPNMADVYLACHAHRFGIPMVALAHKAGWLQNICPAEGRRIYESNRSGDGTLCDTRARRELEMNSIDWTAEPRRPRIRVSIATCNRSHLLSGLLDDLVRESRSIELEVAVYEDPADHDYTLVRMIADEVGWQWHRFDRRLGRDKHCDLVTRELQDCRSSSVDWFVFLPDDVRLIRHALPRAIETWQLLDQPAALTLWRLKNHEGQMNWTGLVPVEREHAFEIFHVDGLYLCRRDTLAFLDFRCPPVPTLRGRTSSGVGRAMSIALHRAGKRMYRVKKSLAVPVSDVASEMNPDARDRRFHPWVYL